MTYGGFINQCSLHFICISHKSNIYIVFEKSNQSHFGYRVSVMGSLFSLKRLRPINSANMPQQQQQKTMHMPTYSIMRVTKAQLNAVELQ